ncbi:endoribonuclease YbeY [Clostridium acetireducens DSM 10703]|uniref:Endoribonuclease YbeY n=1 Tax=Clostridium acetireducens DSM 10703 TaxID=1121290 RepID=A0A1E8F178_9CLOT|nr:rRNA maturation RNase YbeY [Clostridium acetireducens]OFI07180.1 endoribonuclease YbeY [Clostridium acetireducens DSM 10703]
MIFIGNRQNKIEVTQELKDTIINIINYALKEEEVKIECEISVVFIDNNEIKEINREYRGIHKETDVLSFPMLEYPSGRVYKEVYKDYKFKDVDLNNGKLVLGDIAISLEKALAQSEEFGHSFIREVCYLTIHSILHLLGYDHIIESEKELMRKREENILENFNITR